MPNIDSIPVDLFGPLDPYINIVDNIPIIGLIDRVDAVNDAVDLAGLDLSSAIGTQGSLSNRLNQSINQDGSLKTTAIDEAMHSIEDHEDTTDFVRMESAERDKLALIASEATSLTMIVETENAGDITFENDTLILTASDTISWDFDGSKLSASIDFPTSVRHTHYYNVIPFTSNYKNYTTSTVPTTYKQGSLRVYINGIRLNTVNTVPVPFSPSGTIFYVNLKFTEGSASSGIVTGGDFALSSTIQSSASIVIDFDVLYS